MGLTDCDAILSVEVEGIHKQPLIMIFLSTTAVAVIEVKVEVEKAVEDAATA